MIVRPADGVVHLITQPDHAALARRIMEHWRPLDGAARRDLILDAIEHHDDGWHEADAAPVIHPETGAVADFVHVPIAVRQGVWPRGIARAAEAHPWTGALIAMHALSIYERYRPDPAWVPFFDGMERLRAGLSRAAGLADEALAGDYAFVRLGDLASLTFCAGWSETQRYGGFTLTLNGGRLVIRPDPFGGTMVPLEVPARVLSGAVFQSDAAVRNAYGAALPVTVTGEAGGAASDG